jgi:hypothetical protein
MPKKNDIMKNDEIYKMWNDFTNSDKYKIYFINKNDKWKNTLEEVKNYIIKHKKRPTVKDIEDNGQYLSKWLSHQITNYSKKTKSLNDNNNIIEWENFIKYSDFKKYFIDNKTEWINNFKILKNYIDVNKIKPKKNNKDEKINYLANWMYSQYKNYTNKTKIMKDDEIYKIWKYFIENEKYSKYFN